MSKPCQCLSYSSITSPDGCAWLSSLSVDDSETRRPEIVAILKRLKDSSRSEEDKTSMLSLSLQWHFEWWKLRSVLRSLDSFSWKLWDSCHLSHLDDRQASDVTLYADHFDALFQLVDDLISLKEFTHSHPVFMYLVSKPRAHFAMRLRAPTWSIFVKWAKAVKREQQQTNRKTASTRRVERQLALEAIHHQLWQIDFIAEPAAAPTAAAASDGATQLQASQAAPLIRLPGYPLTDDDLQSLKHPHGLSSGCVDFIGHLLWRSTLVRVLRQTNRLWRSRLLWVPSEFSNLVQDSTLSESSSHLQLQKVLEEAINRQTYFHNDLEMEQRLHSTDAAMTHVSHFERVLVPIYLSQFDHWLLLTYRPSARSITLYDSATDSLSKNASHIVALAVAKFFNDLPSSLPVFDGQKRPYLRLVENAAQTPPVTVFFDLSYPQTKVKANTGVYLLHTVARNFYGILCLDPTELNNNMVSRFRKTWTEQLKTQSLVLPLLRKEREALPAAASSTPDAATAATAAADAGTMLAGTSIRGNEEKEKRKATSEAARRIHLHQDDSEQIELGVRVQPPKHYEPRPNLMHTVHPAAPSAPAAASASPAASVPLTSNRPVHPPIRPAHANSGIPPGATEAHITQLQQTSHAIQAQNHTTRVNNFNTISPAAFYSATFAAKKRKAVNDDSDSDDSSISDFDGPCAVQQQLLTNLQPSQQGAAMMRSTSLTLEDEAGNGGMDLSDGEYDAEEERQEEDAQVVAFDVEEEQDVYVARPTKKARQFEPNSRNGSNSNRNTSGVQSHPPLPSQEELGEALHAFAVQAASSRAVTQPSKQKAVQKAAPKAGPGQSRAEAQKIKAVLPPNYDSSLPPLSVSQFVSAVHEVGCRVPGSSKPAQPHLCDGFQDVNEAATLLHTSYSKIGTGGLDTLALLFESMIHLTRLRLSLGTLYSFRSRSFRNPVYELLLRIRNHTGRPNEKDLVSFVEVTNYCGRMRNNLVYVDFLEALLRKYNWSGFNKNWLDVLNQSIPDLENAVEWKLGWVDHASVVNMLSRVLLEGPTIGWTGTRLQKSLSEATKQPLAPVTKKPVQNNPVQNNPHPSPHSAISTNNYDRFYPPSTRKARVTAAAAASSSSSTSSGPTLSTTELASSAATSTSGFAEMFVHRME